MPSAINIPDKGMVFANGTDSFNWTWSAVRATPLQEDDKKLTEDQTHKMDMETKKDFSERDYMDALSYIKVIPE